MTKFSEMYNARSFCCRFTMESYPNGSTLNWEDSDDEDIAGLWDDVLVVSDQGSAYACNRYVPPLGLVTPHSMYYQVRKRLFQYYWGSSMYYKPEL